MIIIERIKDMRDWIKEQKKCQRSIGFVPTMGSLHEGHISLVRASKKDNDCTVISIFVNPTQFGENEDYDTYPRDLAKDSILAGRSGVDVIFAPSAKEIYPADYLTYVDVGEITELLCGKSRPGHFRGVTTVLCKLFNIVCPNRAYFGQKDAQQAVVVSKMVEDLNIDLEIVVCPIIREKDGLAMSSRNRYLDAAGRKSALILSRSLFEAEEMIKKGERDSRKILDFICDRISGEPGARLEYAEIVDAGTLRPVDTIEGKILAALAVRVGTTRLIDNIMLEI